MNYLKNALKIRPILEKAVISLPDKEALEVAKMFPNWDIGVDYITDERVQYMGVLYKVLQNHHSQVDWTPDISPSLFAKVLIPDENTIPEWEQPDSTNPYMKGDKVMFEGKVYISTVDNNVWKPTEYGWEKIESGE